MKNYIFFLLVTLTSSGALAQKIESNVQEDAAFLFPMSKGQSAPFPGILLSPPAAIKIITDHNVFESRLKLEVDTAVSIARAKLLFDLKEQESKCLTEKSIQDARISSSENKVRLLEKELARSEQELLELKSSIPSRSTWFGIGFASSVIFTIATAYAIGQVSN
jgi:hypothetical protein